MLAARSSVKYRHKFVFGFPASKCTNNIVWGHRLRVRSCKMVQDHHTAWQRVVSRDEANYMSSILEPEERNRSSLLLNTERWAKCRNFDVLLTVHYSNDQFWFQLMHHNFTLLTKSLYMFRAPACPSSGGQTKHTPQLVQLHLL